MLLLYLEVLKAARFGTKAIMDHVLSLVLFVAHGGGVHAGAAAATPTFLLLTVLASST